MNNNGSIQAKRIDALRGVIAARELVIARQQAEIEQLRRVASQRLAETGECCRKILDQKSELAECRTLLRQAVAHLGDVRTNDNGVREWVEAAREAAGGDDAD